jgi:single-stranded DNA-binding protein
MTIECAVLAVIHKAEVKTSPAGKSFVRINARSGEGEAAQWLSIVSFDQATIDSADKMVKGARVYVEGHISLNSWTGKDGVARQGLSVRARHCRLAQIGKARTKPATARNKTISGVAPSGAAPFNDDLPFAAEWR